MNILNIDRIEFVDGAMSALYGSSAMGGVVNIITKKNYYEYTAEHHIVPRIAWHLWETWTRIGRQKSEQPPRYGPPNLLCTTIRILNVSE